MAAGPWAMPMATGNLTWQQEVFQRQDYQTAPAVIWPAGVRTADKNHMEALGQLGRQGQHHSALSGPAGYFDPYP